MRPRPFLLGNWKLHHRIAQARAWAQAYAEARPRRCERLDVAIAPPATALWALAQEGLGERVTLCAQDAYVEDQGAYTGALGAPMLADAGAKWLLIGHSERRRHFGETNESTERRAQAAVRAGLRPVLCVGETAQQRAAGQSEAVVRAQWQAAWPALRHSACSFALAYEPVWAIGGQSAALADVACMHQSLRADLCEQLGQQAGEQVPIAYGGGVKAEDVAGLLGQPDVDGLLVGGASLSADSFVAILAAMERAIESRLS